MDTRRIMLTVAYDGTAYNGWQIQPGVATIEGVLDEKILEITGENVHVIGASRTDSGVHAEGAIAVFDTASRIPAEKFAFALNAHLPDDIRIRKSQEVPSGWHPRHAGGRKTYTYSIYNDTFELPSLRLYSHHIYGALDIENMQKACEHFVGEHDFAAFCSAHSQCETTVRTIYDMHIELEHINSARLIRIYVTGNGFLYNMVRIIAGTLIDVGLGRLSPDDIINIIENRDRSLSGDTAPAKGLTLIGYSFDDYPKLIP